MLPDSRSRPKQNLRERHSSSGSVKFHHSRDCTVQLFLAHLLHMTQITDLVSVTTTTTTEEEEERVAGVIRQNIECQRNDAVHAETEKTLEIV